MVRKVEVVPYDSRWREEFESESKLITNALSENIAAIHHIGSTAIPGIYAKPIIDILVEVKGMDGLDRQSSSMELLGYKMMGEFGIPGRRYFRKDNQEGSRTHHVHIYEVGSGQIERHLIFRDYMIAHPGEAQQYSQLKRKLAKEHPANIDGYMDGKDRFIKDMDAIAEKWRSSE